MCLVWGTCVFGWGHVCGGQKMTLDVLALVSTLLFWERVSHWIWSSSFQLAQRASNFLWSSRLWLSSSRLRDSFAYIFSWVLGIQAVYQLRHFSSTTKALVSVLNTKKTINMWSDEYVNWLDFIVLHMHIYLY